MLDARRDVHVITRIAAFLVAVTSSPFSVFTGPSAMALLTKIR